MCEKWVREIMCKKRVKSIIIRSDIVYCVENEEGIKTAIIGAGSRDFRAYKSYLGFRM